MALKSKDMKIVLAYLEEKADETKRTLEKAEQMNCKKKYLDFLKTKERQFRKAIDIVSEAIA